MKKINIPKKLNNLALCLNKPLYVVGGYVRNNLLGFDATDIDITSALMPNEIKKALKNSEFTVANSNLRVGTLIIKGENFHAEYTTFRQDNYPDNGQHTPDRVTFTSDIFLDAARRDFKVNAIYYDILKDKIVDPLGGITDLKNKILSTTVSPQKVFGEDGLRILRLCRFAAELGFSIENETLFYAKKLVEQIKDLSVERITVELKKIILADTTYGVKDGHFLGMSLLNDIGALDLIFPPLKDCRGFKQNPKYHLHDVLTHLLIAYKVAPPKIRIAALLHDIAKPYCQINFGNMHRHAEVGKEMVEKLLGEKGLKFSNDEIEFTSRLVGEHMYNLTNETKDDKLKLFIQRNYDIVNDIEDLMRADAYSAMEIESERADRLEVLAKEMKDNHIPLKVKDLKVNGDDLISLNVPPTLRSKVLNKLLIQSIKFSIIDREGQLKKLNEILKTQKII